MKETKFTSSLRWMNSNIRSLRKKGSFKHFSVISAEEASSFIVNSFIKKDFSLGVIDDLTTLLLYEGLLVEKRVKKDFGKLIYSAYESRLKINEGTLSYKVLFHIYRESYKAFISFNIAFIELSKRMRYVLKETKAKTKYVDINDFDKVKDTIFSLFVERNILVVSPHENVIKVQYVRLKDLDKYKDSLAFNLSTLNIDKIIERVDRTSYFEAIDAIKMELITYQFDVALIDNDIYSLPLCPIFSSLNTKVLIVDKRMYSLFDICYGEEYDNDEYTLRIEEFEKERRSSENTGRFLSNPDNY